MAEKQEKEEQKDKKIESYGQVLLGEDEHNGKIQLMTIIGEIEGHDVLPAASKTTKYEHILPQLASIEDSAKIGGVLFLINTVGGDVSAGLALAEMIASMKTRCCTGSMHAPFPAHNRTDNKMPYCGSSVPWLRVYSSNGMPAL